MSRPSSRSLDRSRHRVRSRPESNKESIYKARPRSKEDPVSDHAVDKVRRDDTLYQSKKKRRSEDRKSSRLDSRSAPSDTYYTHQKDGNNLEVEDVEEHGYQSARSRGRLSSDKEFEGHPKDLQDSPKNKMFKDRRSDHSDHEHRQRSSKTSDYKRYWGSGDSEVHNTSKTNDRYWSKYPAKDKERSVGSRYYGEHSKSRPLQDDKENLKRKRQMDNDVKSSDPRRSVRKGDILSGESSMKNDEPSVVPVRQKKNLDMLTTKTGGAYIPPARLRMMQAQITDKSSAAYQRISWEALKKSIHGHINKVNTGNIGIIVRELLKENVVRGRGLLCRSIIQAQAASLTFTHVYAALVSVINSKFPNIGELLLRRLIIQFKRGFKRNDKSICISAASFIAHLVNQRVAHEILALEILTLLVESPTDDSVEVAIAFLKECGMKLMEVSNKGIHAIFEMLRNILHEGHLDKRVQYMIEVMHQVRKDNFQDHKAIIDDLDVVDEEDQFTHLLTLEDVKDPEDILNVFKFNPTYEEDETKYKILKKEILDEDSDDSGSNSGSEGDSEEESEVDEENKESTIIDNTETNLVALRRTIYLTISSSLDFEECAHKLMRMELKPGQEIELCHMFLDCCAEQRTYEKFYGLLSQRFCQINKIFIPPFQQIFRNTYDTIHRLDTNKLRNVAKFFAHLLFTDAISWEVLSLIRLNEEETNSSSRIFIKILFQELSEYMGLTKLNERVKDGTLQAAFDGLFPRDDPKHTRFAINFFTSIGLGGLTDELREHLKSQPKISVVPRTAETQVPSNSSNSDSSSSSSSDSSSDSSSSSSSESEDSNDDHRRKNVRSGGKDKQSRNKKKSRKRVHRKKSNASESPVEKKKKKKKKKKGVR